MILSASTLPRPGFGGKAACKGSQAKGKFIKFTYIRINNNFQSGEAIPERFAGNRRYHRRRLLEDTLLTKHPCNLDTIKTCPCK